MTIPVIWKTSNYQEPPPSLLADPSLQEQNVLNRNELNTNYHQWRVGITYVTSPLSSWHWPVYATQVSFYTRYPYYSYPYIYMPQVFILTRHSICWDSSQSGTPSPPSWTTDRHGRIVIGNWNIWRPLPLSPPLLASSARNWCRPGTVTLGYHTTASWLTSLWASERVCEELDKPLDTVCWTLKG